MYAPIKGMGTMILAAETATAPSRFFHPTDDRTKVESPEAAATILVDQWLAGLDREACAVVYLDTKHQVLSTELVSMGSLDHTFMQPREILRGALLANAAALIIAHNHPSGDPTPSADDRAITRRIVQAGDIVGIDVLDHLVVAGTRWLSLARQGLCD